MGWTQSLASNTWLLKIHFGSFYCSRVVRGFCFCFFRERGFFLCWQCPVLPYHIWGFSFYDPSFLYNHLIYCQLVIGWRSKTRLYNELLSDSCRFKSPCVLGLVQCYFFDVAHLNPSLGRLYQVEYAMEAIGHAGTCLGILANDGVLLAAERRNIHKLLDEVFFSEKIYKLNE